VYLGPDDLVTLTWNRTNVPRFEADAEDGRLVGVVAQADVAREADAATTGQVVEEIDLAVEIAGRGGALGRRAVLMLRPAPAAQEDGDLCVRREVLAGFGRLRDHAALPDLRRVGPPDLAERAVGAA